MESFNGKLWVGTSGYSYPHWTRGAFYPVGLKHIEELSFYARHFSTFEINLSHYRLPSLETLQRWAQVTPEDFIFAAKLNRTITHYRKLKKCEESLKRNGLLRQGLGNKLAVVLAQLPPNLPIDLPRLREFLKLLHTDAGNWIPRLAIEFRDPSWYTDECYQLLDEFNCAICLADWGHCETRRPNNSDFLYIRRHGGREGGCYSPDQIMDDVRLVQEYLKCGKMIFVYYNNDFNCYAIRNAHELLNAIKGR